MTDVSGKPMKPKMILDLQEQYKALREIGIGSSKSAAIEKMADGLENVISLGFLKREVWEAFRDVGYEGSYAYFTRKLDRLGITRRQIGVRPRTSRAALEKEATHSSIVTTAAAGAAPQSGDELEAQRLRLEEARRRGDLYRQSEPQSKKKFDFNPES